MLIKDIENASFFMAVDNTYLCELLHPLRDKLNLPYSIAYAILNPGCSSIPHRLKESSEVYYILEGEGLMHVDAESAEVMEGQAILIPPGSWQHIHNSGTDDLKFLAIVYPFWRREDEEVRGGNGREEKRD